MLAKIKWDQLRSFEWQSRTQITAYSIYQHRMTWEAGIALWYSAGLMFGTWGRWFESWQVQQENVLLPGQHSVPTFCADSYFGNPHPPTRPTHHKWSRSFCQICKRCQWQVTAKHIHTLRIWLQINLRTELHRMFTEKAAVSCVASHVTTKQRCQYTTLADIQNRAV